MKTCTRCKISKELEFFHKNQRSSDGRSSRCGACRTEIHNAYQKTEAGKAVARKFRQNPVNLAKQRVWQNNRCKVDLDFRLRRNLRNRLRLAIKNSQKVGSAVEDLGCSVLELRKHLESGFQPGMSWDNWGHGPDKWNIDHIRPLVSFDLTDREEFLKATHFTNLQPLWHVDNAKKRETDGTFK